MKTPGDLIIDQSHTCILTEDVQIKLDRDWSVIGQSSVHDYEAECE